MRSRFILHEDDTPNKAVDGEKNDRHVLMRFSKRKRVLTCACHGKRDADGLLEAVQQGFSAILPKPEFIQEFYK